ncbi:MAG: dTDP-4-dehydrorhamnose reductase [Kangiellaceae bacterium]|nr:dTDP-4-dehydrorhamnose reductase [Kangiellaceae bacterium]
MNVLVSGANGQLGLCLKDILDNKSVTAVYLGRHELDVTDKVACLKAIQHSNIDIWINCSAYTNVDLAEQEIEQAEKVNHFAVKNIAETCNEFNIPLIHISTDYVYDGTATIPYKEDSKTSPQSVYGRTKLLGELSIKSLLSKFIIIRTSWLYSEYNKNFVKTMLQLAKNKQELSVVNDQVGSPTYARDLAETIYEVALKLVSSDANDNSLSGVYHYANQGKCSWFDFSVQIFQEAQRLRILKNIPDVTPVTSEQFKTLAKRPLYSVLDSTKIVNQFKLENRTWHEALVDMLSILNVKSESL